MKHVLPFSLILVFAAAAAPAADPPCKEARKDLAAQAKVSCAEARKAALTALGKQDLRILSAELEEENGKLVYSFDVERTGQPGADEVQIDARSGQVIPIAHETPAAEAAEHD